jgi:hypothetical protein
MSPAARTPSAPRATSPGDTTSGTESPPAATTAARAAARDATDTAAGVATSAGRIVPLPVTVARAVADDIAETARRPDVVLYRGGLAGLAAPGPLGWPVAAAVGVAIAGGRPRTLAA